MDDETVNEDNTPPIDVTPVPEPGNIDPPTEPEKAVPLPVKIPLSFLRALDNECTERGITRSELVKSILQNYYQGKGKVSTSELQRINEGLVQENKILKTENGILVQQRDNQQAKPSTHDYVAELEVDLLKSVDIACNSIMASRSDFRKKLKHYGRLETDRT